MQKLSIITVNLNNAAGLRKTIESVRAQTFRNFEHIIIDGGSNDESVNVIKEFKSGFSYWVSEPDGGIYQGMNKGTKFAKGEYCLYLNSGDYLYNSKALEKVFSEKFSEDLIYGYTILKYNAQKKHLLKNDSNVPGFGYHPSTLIKHTLLKKLDGYSEQFKIISDRHFFMRATFVYGASYRHIPVKISVFNNDGISSNQQSAKLIKQEYLKMEKEILPNIPIRLAIMSSFLINSAGKIRYKNISYDMQEKMKNKDVYLWGVALRTMKLLNFLKKKHIRIEAFLDSNKEFQELAFAGYKIYEPEFILTNKKNIFIVIASEFHHKEMAKICEKYGLKNDKDFYIPFKLDTLPFQ